MPRDDWKYRKPVEEGYERQGERQKRLDLPGDLILARAGTRKTKEKKRPGKSQRCTGKGCNNFAKRGNALCGLCKRRAECLRKPPPPPTLPPRGPDNPSGPCERCDQETPCSDLLQRLGVWMCGQCRRKDEMILAKQLRMAQTKAECTPF